MRPLVCQRPDIQVPRLGQDKAEEHDGVRVREASQEAGQFAVVKYSRHNTVICYWQKLAMKFR